MIRRRNPRLFPRQFFYGIINKSDSNEDIIYFEKKFSEYLNIKYSIAVDSGRTALKLILDNLNLFPQDEIIIPAYTLKDLILLVKKMQLIPVLADVEKDSFNVDPDSIEKLITSKTKVIIATHLFGLPCNMLKIKEIAKKHNLFVIEDCAHACGANIDGKKVGTWGDAAFFSFETIKLLNTFGGGMISTNSDTIYREILDSLKVYPDKKDMKLKVITKLLEHLIIKSPFYPILLYLLIEKFTQKIVRKIYLLFNKKPSFVNLKYTQSQALMGIKQLSKLDYLNRIRADIAKDIIKKVKSQVNFQHSDFDKGRVFYFLVGTLNKDSESFRKKIFFYGVDVGIKDEITDDCTGFQLNFEKYISKFIYNKNVQFPLYDDMSKDDISKLSERFIKAYEN